MTDNAELVHISYQGLYFTALVDIMMYDQKVSLFYEYEPVGELFSLFEDCHRYAITRLAVKAAVKQRAERAAHDKRGDAIYQVKQEKHE